MIRALSLLILLFSALSAGDIDEKLPTFISKGLDVYKKSGIKEAVKVWVKDGPMEDSKDLLSLPGTFDHIEGMVGKYKDFNVLDVVSLSENFVIIYLELNYDKGAVFANFFLYRRGKKHVLQKFNFNTDPSKILPPRYFANY